MVKINYAAKLNFTSTCATDLSLHRFDFLVQKETERKSSMELKLGKALSLFSTVRMCSRTRMRILVFTFFVVRSFFFLSHAKTGNTKRDLTKEIQWNYGVVDFIFVGFGLFTLAPLAKLCACLIGVFLFHLLSWITWINAHASLNFPGSIQMHILLHFKYISWLPFSSCHRIRAQLFSSVKNSLFVHHHIITYGVNNILYLSKMLDVSIVTMNWTSFCHLLLLLLFFFFVRFARKAIL